MRIAERVITILPPDPEVKVPEGFKESTINIDGHKVQGWVWAVSYTHLDVYKRQPIAFSHPLSFPS